MIGWRTYGQGEQWADLSLRDNGFAPGTFLSLGPMGRDQSVLVWDGVMPATWHYLRINTLTGQGWQQSDTIVFLTRGDCGPTGDADYDQVPDEADLCPFEAGTAVYAGCRAPAPALPEGASAACLRSFADPDRPGGCLWQAKGDYGSYNLGESVYYCYSINQPMDLRIVAHKPDGSSTTLLAGFTDASGWCLPALVAGAPPGPRNVDLLGPQNQLLDQTHFIVR
jgi:hypothetical protein